MGTLFGFVAPIVAHKQLSKLTGLHAIFRKLQYPNQTWGFMHLRSQCPLGDVKTEGDKSGDYRGKLDQPIVHG